MKKLIVLLLVVVSFVGCEKEDDVHTMNQQEINVFVKNSFRSAYVNDVVTNRHNSALYDLMVMNEHGGIRIGLDIHETSKTGIYIEFTCMKDDPRNDVFLNECSEYIDRFYYVY